MPMVFEVRSGIGWPWAARFVVDARGEPFPPLWRRTIPCAETNPSKPPCCAILRPKSSCPVSIRWIHRGLVDAVLKETSHRV
jgi:hypothetical protein